MISYLPVRQLSTFMTRRSLVRFFSVAAVLIVTCGVNFAQGSGDHGPRIKVMTRNLYQGTDFVEAMSAPDQASFLGAVCTITQNVLATKPTERIDAVAQEIATNAPDLVALQEATVWEISGGGTYVKIDPIASLLADLKAMGEPYVAEIVQPQFDFQAPCPLGPGFMIHTTTQIAILSRKDSRRGEMKVKNSAGGLFQYELTVPSAMGDITVNRGWAYVDLVYEETPLRFVTAHPEAFADLMENAQVFELLNGIANPAVAGRSVIMAADFNTDGLAAADSSFRVGYDMITGMAGFTDAWAATQTTPALTCCQDNDLLNPISKLSEEIDFVFVRGLQPGQLVPESAKLTGNLPASRVDGLWPSDHAGVVARIRVHE